MTLSAVGGQGECCLARHLGTTGPPAAPTARVGCHGLRTSTRRRPVQRPPTSAPDNPGTCPPRPRRFLRGVVHGWPRRPAPGRSLPTRSPCHRLPAPQPVTRGGVEDYLANSAVDQAQVEAFEGFEVALRTLRGGNPDFSLDAVRCSAERIGRAQRQQRVRFAGDDRANAASADVDPRWSEVPAAEPLEDSDHHRHRGRRPRHRRRRWCCPSSGEKPLTESGFW